MERESLMEIPQNLRSKNKHKFQHHFDYLERTVDSYNTSFSYTIQDAQKIPIIQTAILNVQRLMPYAILFNQKLQYYEFLDTRTNPKNNLSFAIEKVSLKELKNSKKSNHFYLFTYLFKSLYNQKLHKFSKLEQRYMVAFLDDSKRVYAAIPVSNCGGRWMIQNIAPDHCQLFKDFPLIGSAKIQWNAVINSDNFYPNQKRSQLMLTHFDKLSQNKVAENKKELQNCFEGIKQLYLFLALQYCHGGFRNLLNFSDENAFTKQFPLFKRVLKSNIDTFSAIRFVPTGQKGNEKCSLKQLNFIQLSQLHESTHKKTQSQMSLSMKINQTFRFLFEDNHVISEECYEDFFTKLHKDTLNKDTFIHKNKMINVNSIKQCLKKMENNKYIGFKRKFITNLFPKLNEIYTLLVENRIQFADYKIVLNENNEFKSLSHDMLMVKKIDPVVEQLFILLGIDIKNRTIKQEFSKIFESNQKPNFLDDQVAASQINKQFETLFKLYQQLALTHIKEKEHQNAPLTLLFSLLLTLNQIPEKQSNPRTVSSSRKKEPIVSIQKLTKKQEKGKELPVLNMETIKKFKLFSKVESFKLFNQIKNLAPLKKHCSLKLMQIFADEFEKYFQRLQVQYKQSFKKLCQHELEITNQDEGGAFLVQLFSESSLGLKLSSLNLKLTLDNTFSQSYTVYKLAENIAYPTEEDVEVYEILRLQANDSQQKPLKQRLIMPIYPTTDRINTTTYSNLFYNVKQNFDSLNDMKKHTVLSYAKSINDQFMKGTCVNPTIAEKHKAWKNFIDSRVTKMFNLKNNLKTFESEPVKEFLYDLFDNENELKKTAEAYGKRNRQKEFISQIIALNNNKANKKIKKQ